MTLVSRGHARDRRTRTSHAEAAAHAAAFAIASILACSDPDHVEDENQFRTDVVLCEETLARLTTCCANFDPLPVASNHYYSFDRCYGSEKTRKVEPVFTQDESRCILDSRAMPSPRTASARAQQARGVDLTIDRPTDSDTSQPTTTGTV
jgi:hypothetical protein